MVKYQRLFKGMLNMVLFVIARILLTFFYPIYLFFSLSSTILLLSVRSTDYPIFVPFIFTSAFYAPYSFLNSFNYFVCS
jgi:hypothetical protein